MIKFSKKYNSLFNFILGILGGILISLCIIFISVGNPKELVEFLKNYNIIKRYYYRDVSDKELFECALKGMTKSLNDPYSIFLNKDEYSALLQETNGEYSGVGIILGKNKNEDIVVMGVLENSSAKQNGILNGDIILEVNRKSIDKNDLSQVASKIRGKAGTEVFLTVKRNGIEKEIKLERKDINLPTVKSNMATDTIGYIHIYSFGTRTSDEVKSALSDLKSKGAKKFIIDLRMNPGGIIDSVVDVSNQFLHEGTVVSYCPKNGNEKIYKIDGVKTFYPIVVLIDKYSASASEIFAGAVQDKKEGIVIGEKSFGKGTVQSIITNSDGTALKVSIAEYKTAKG
ncbi:MAG: S41 family peptidase, partial [Dialister micraerophilus]|nr:S41 family peptidase [Dialister micraerophilus]